MVSYNLATKAYKEELYDEAYEYALKGCENEDHPSKGCDLLAMMIIEGKPTVTSVMSYDDKIMEAIGYTTIGHEKKDINSTAFLHDIYNQPFLLSKYSNNKLAEEFLLDLKKSKELSAKIQVKESCFTADPLKAMFKNCKPSCAWAKRKNKAKEMDIVSRYLLKSIINQNVCK